MIKHFYLPISLYFQKRIFYYFCTLYTFLDIFPFLPKAASIKLGLKLTKKNK